MPALKSGLLAFSAALVLAAGSVQADVKWNDEPFDQVLARAKQENKYVFIDFYATWCGPCKRLDEKVYPDATVSGLLNSMVSVKYDAEKEPWLPIAKKYKVNKYPTLLVLDPNGQEVDRHIGYLDPEPFVATIEGYRNGIATTAALTAQIKETPDDLDLLYKLGMKHADAGRSVDAATVLGKAMELDPKDTKGRNAEMLYALGEANYTDNRFAEAKPCYEKLVTEYPNSDLKSASYKRLATTQYKLGEKFAAVDTYWKSLEGKEEDPSALNGFAWFCAQRKIGLDRALPAADKAAKLSNRDPGILDTLAEVYLAMGDYGNAIKIGEEAAARDPNDSYLKDQVEKYKKAKVEAEQARR